MNRKSLYSCVVLVLYSVLLIPSFVLHDHEDGHDHSPGLACESMSQLQHFDIVCSHDHHYDNQESACVLCDYYSVYEHTSSMLEITSHDFYAIEKHDEFNDGLYYQDFNNDRNKSPPPLI